MKHYEYVQVQVYLKLMDLEKAKLIEQFNNDTHTAEIRFDEPFFFGTVAPHLAAFVKRVDAILTDPAEQEAYKRARSKEWVPRPRQAQR